MDVKFSSRSDLGKVRDKNEDTIISHAEKGFFAVCDGFGESSYGKVASALSAETLLRYFEQGIKEKKPEINSVLKSDAVDLAVAIQLANLRLYNFVDKYIDFYGMGSTVASLYVKNGYAFIGHVGDSRVYLFRDRQLELLTSDHSYVNELIRMGRIKKEDADRYVNKHFITRSLGMAESIRIDMNIKKAEQNDLFILCSDGLNHMVSDKEIGNIIAASNADCKKISNDLINRANELGGDDDISIITLKINESAEPPTADSAQKEGVVYISESPADIVTMENGLLEKIFGKDLYPEEVKVS